MSYWSVSDELNFKVLSEKHPFLSRIHKRGSVYEPRVTAPWGSVSQVSVPESGESK